MESRHDQCGDLPQQVTMQDEPDVTDDAWPVEQDYLDEDYLESSDSRPTSESVEALESVTPKLLAFLNGEREHLELSNTAKASAARVLWRRSALYDLLFAQFMRHV